MDFLKTLQIKALNPGVSTGTNWINTKTGKIDSYSQLMENLLAQ